MQSDSIISNTISQDIRLKGHQSIRFSPDGFSVLVSDASYRPVYLKQYTFDTPIQPNQLSAEYGRILEESELLTFEGETVFIVDSKTPGFSVGVKEDKMGVRASNTSELVFEDVRVPQENILGNPGEGFKMAMKILDFGRIGIAAQCVGLGQAALEASIKYANERVQFNKPIGRFQAIQWKIADMAVAIESARLFTYKAAYLHDNGEDFSMASAMAKLVASEAAMQAAHGAVQIHGGYGLMKAYPVERYFRDAKMGEIYEGTSEIQRLVISRLETGLR